jgi:hypothetical protein
MKAPDNLNHLGKMLIQKKHAGDLTFEIFKNLLVQCVIIGADDPSVKKMYDFIT